MKAGALVDDSPAYLERLPVVYRRGKEKGVVLTLEDVPDVIAA